MAIPSYYTSDFRVSQINDEEFKTYIHEITLVLSDNLFAS